MPCEGCGEPFDAAVTYAGREPIIATHCPACSRRRIDAMAAVSTARAEPDSEETILAALHAVGCNVQRHGRIDVGALEQDELRSVLSGWVHRVVNGGRWGEVQGLYVVGPTGTGKSQGAVSALRALLQRGVPQAQLLYDRGRALITELQDRYRTGAVDEYLARRRRARVWVYDDGGTEKLTADSFRVLEDLIDSREGKATIITTNLPREEFAGRWKGFDGWERLRSRLAAYRVVTLTGRDQRFDRDV